MAKEKGRPAQDYSRYLMSGIGLCCLGLALSFYTYFWYLYGGRLLLIVPVGAAVCFLMGPLFILKYLLGDKVDWE